MINETVARPNAQLRVAWWLVGGGYAVVFLAFCIALLLEKTSSPGPGTGAAMVGALVFSALGLLLCSAFGGAIALLGVRGGVIPRSAATTVLALAVLGVALPATFLAAILLRGG